MMLSTLDKKIAFVIPWYSQDMTGGAEVLCRNYCERLHAAGIDVEVFTTTVRDSQSNWGVDYYDSGSKKVNGVPVHYFPVRDRNVTIYDRINKKLLNQYVLTDHEEHLFYSESIRSTEMEDYIKTHIDEYYFVFLPYCFGVTYYGILAAEDSGVLLPCLHKEGYALLSTTMEMFLKAGKIIFNSNAEYIFANHIFELEHKPQITLGFGMGNDSTGNPDELPEKLKRENPYLFYIGRKDRTKNIPLLLDYMQHLISDGMDQVRLFIAGPGKVDIPIELKGNVSDLGLLTEDEKVNLISGSLALVQPSINESLSIVMLEAWRENTPVLVNGLCDVTDQMCRDANGGLSFKNYFEFKESIDYLLNHSREREILGLQGNCFLKKNHQWDGLLKRFIEFLSMD